MRATQCIKQRILKDKIKSDLGIEVAFTILLSVLVNFCFHFGVKSVFLFSFSEPLIINEKAKQ